MGAIEFDNGPQRCPRALREPSLRLVSYSYASTIHCHGRGNQWRKRISNDKRAYRHQLVYPYRLTCGKDAPPFPRCDRRSCRRSPLPIQVEPFLLKTAQELLRHANARITLDVYTRAISATKREANNRVMTMVLDAGKKKVLFSTLVGAS